MRTKLLSKIFIVVFIFSIFVCTPQKGTAASENTIRAVNILGQGVGTLLKGIIQGKVKNLKSAGKMLFWGSVAGYGFYESKKMIGNGQVTTGYILANISASVTENISRGDTPFSYLGYTLGPVRIQVKTPFKSKNKTLLNVNVSPADVIGFFTAKNSSDTLRFRSGLLTFEANDFYRDTARGWTYGIYPTVVSGVPEHVFYHEAIHAVQYVQTMSISPQPFNCPLDRGLEQKKLLNISLLNFNYASLITRASLNNETDPRLDNWNEVEAYALARE